MAEKELQTARMSVGPPTNEPVTATDKCLKSVGNKPHSLCSEQIKQVIATSWTESNQNLVTAESPPSPHGAYPVEPVSGDHGE